MHFGVSIICTKAALIYQLKLQIWWLQLLDSIRSSRGTGAFISLLPLDLRRVRRGRAIGDYRVSVDKGPPLTSAD
jgi:hypothetical protein